MFWSYMEATGNSDCSVLRSFPEEGSCLAGTSVTRLLGWSSECGACGSHSPALPASVSRLHSPFLPGPAVPPAIYLLQFSPIHFSASLRSVQLVVSNFCDHTLCTCVHLFPRNWMRTDDPSQPGKEVQVHCPTPGPLNSAHASDPHAYSISSPRNLTPSDSLPPELIEYAKCITGISTCRPRHDLTPCPLPCLHLQMKTESPRA